jgi:hypothetical protein
MMNRSKSPHPNPSPNFGRGAFRQLETRSIRLAKVVPDPVFRVIISELVNIYRVFNTAKCLNLKPSKSLP